MTHIMRTPSGGIVYVDNMKDAPPGSVCIGVERKIDGFVKRPRVVRSCEAQMELI